MQTSSPAMIAGILRAAPDADEDTPMPISDAARHAEGVRRAYELLIERHVFAPGDLVCWKPGLKDTAGLAYGQPVIIVRFEPGRLDKHGDPSDMRVLLLNHDGQMAVEYWLDTRRIQPWPEASSNA